MKRTLQQDGAQSNANEDAGAQKFKRGSGRAEAMQGRVAVNKKPSGFLALAPHRNKARNERRRGTRTPNSALWRAYISI